MSWRSIVLAALVALPATAGADTWREQSRQTLEARGLEALEIHNARGLVELLPSSDGRIHLTALKIVRLTGRDRAREMAEDIVVETGRRGNRHRVDVRYPRHRALRLGLREAFSGFEPRYEVRITAEVPAGLAVEVRSASGTIRSEGIRGAQVLGNVSGDIEVLDAGGRVRVTTTSGSVNASGLGAAHVSSVSGDLELSAIRGPLGASTASGSIRVTGADDSLTLGSVSGSIELDRAPRGLVVRSSSGQVTARSLAGKVKAGTVSGDLSLALREPLQGLEASSSSGAIRIVLANNVRCALTARSSSGTLEVELPMEMRNVTQRGVSGTIRGGKTPVSLRTVSGDITVVGGGQ